MKPTSRSDDAEAFVRRLTTDFPFFVRALWTARDLHDKAPLSEVDYEIMRWAAGRRGGDEDNGKFRIVLAPRGAGKTNFVSCALAAFRLLQDPDHRVVIISKSEKHAVKVMGILRDWFSGNQAVPFLRHLAPRDGQRDSQTQMDVGPASYQVQPSITSIGIDGPVEGNRAHTVIGDDVETEPNTRTQDARERLEHRCEEFMNLLYPVPPGRDDTTEVVLVGTCHHEESLYHKLAARNYRLRTWPIAYPDPREREAIVNLSPTIAGHLDSGAARPGQPVFPSRLSADRIADLQSASRRGFLMQNMLIARMGESDLYPLKLADLIVTTFGDKMPVEAEWGTRTNSGTTALADIASLGFSGDRLYAPVLISEPQDWTKPTGTKAFIDPAGRGQDEFALAVASHLGGRIYVRAVCGFLGAPDENLLLHIALILRELRVQEVAVEDQADALGMLRNILHTSIQRVSLRPGDDRGYPQGWNCSVVSHHATGRKQARIIDTLEPLMANHRLIVHPDCVGDTPMTPFNLPRAGGPRCPATEDSNGAFNPGDGVVYTLQHQLTRMTREAAAPGHDDRADALAGVVGLWTHTARIDPDKAANAIKDHARDTALREHARLSAQQWGRSATGYRGTPKDPSYLGHRHRRK